MEHIQDLGNESDDGNLTHLQARYFMNEYWYMETGLELHYSLHCPVGISLQVLVDILFVDVAEN